VGNLIQGDDAGTIRKTVKINYGPLKNVGSLTFDGIRGGGEKATKGEAIERV